MGLESVPDIRTINTLKTSSSRKVHRLTLNQFHALGLCWTLQFVLEAASLSAALWILFLDGLMGGGATRPPLTPPYSPSGSGLNWGADSELDRCNLDSLMSNRSADEQEKLDSFLLLSLWLLLLDCKCFLVLSLYCYWILLTDNWGQKTFSIRIFLFVSPVNLTRSSVSNPAVNLSVWWWWGASSAGLSNLRPGEACPTR